MQAADDARTVYDAWRVLVHDEHARADRPWHNLVLGYLTESDVIAAYDAVGHYSSWWGRLPAEPEIFRRYERWLWPFGMHSISVAVKP